MRKHYWWRLSLMAFGLLVLAFNARSQDSAPSSSLPHPLHQTLKDIQPAGVSCRKEDFAENPSGAVHRRKNADPSCAINLEQVATLLGKPDTMLIDIRTKELFDNGHIPGAINFSRSEIRTKAFLKDRLIVLIGEGKADQDLYELCAELKEAGFKQTRVLNGGMLSWALDQMPVAGDTSEVLRLASLSAAELFQETKIASNIVISLGNGKKLSDVIPAAVHLAGNDAEAIKEYIKMRKKSPAPYNIVLVADERFNKDQIADLAQFAKPVPFLVYHESEESYRQFLRVQNALWAKQAKGPNKPRCGI